MIVGRLEGQIAFITGAGSGIGRATALRFAREGARVLAFDRQAQGLETLAAEAQGEVVIAVGDVTSAEQIAAAVETCTSHFGSPDILVSSAGTVGHGGMLEQMGEDDWDNLFDVNVKGTFLCCRAIIPLMRAKGGGAIVNLSSTAGLVGSAALGGYSATKGAIVLMTRSLALRHAADQIRVNCVCPGSTETPQLVATFETAGPDPEEQRRMSDLYRSKQPLGRFGRPDEVANAILFLASNEASFITGVSLPVDGGRIA